MKSSALKYWVLTTTATIISLVIVLIPFHAFLTVWLSSLIGHYTALRLWKEVLLVLCGIGAFYLVITDHKIRFHTLTRKLTWLILAYAVLLLILGGVAYKHGNISLKALGYALVVDLRFFLFFFVVWAVAVRTNRLSSNWLKVLLVPALIVACFAIVQELLLPARFLEHFGYSKHTILPFQYVNNDPSFIRAQSTLRGANPLGAYLVIPITIAAAFGLRNILRGSKLRLAVLATSAFALAFTYSRSAWIGAIIALISLGVVEFNFKALTWRRTIPILVGLVAVVGLTVSFWDNVYFQNIVFHTQAHSKAPISSNEAHASALRSGIHDLEHEPLGRGPGTAGPASVYNNHPPRNPEDYYVEIGQESGWLGLILFLGINFILGLLLWYRRDDPLARGLLASLIGISIINLFLPAWTDDTLAYLWWGLAGIAMTPREPAEQP